MSRFRKYIPDSNNTAEQPAKIDTREALLERLQIPPKQGYTAEARHRLMGSGVTPPPERELKGVWTAFKEEIPQTAGGIVGGLAGFTIGGPVGAVIGAGIGGAGGEGWRQGLKMWRGGPDAPTMGEAYTEEGKGFVEEVAGELVGQGFSKALTKLGFNPVKSSLVPDAQEMAKLAEKYGTHFRPAQLANKGFIGWLYDTADVIAEKSFFGGRRMKAMKLLDQPAAAKRFATDVANEFVERAGGKYSIDDLGRMIVLAKDVEYSLFDAESDAMYKALKAKYGTQQVDISSLLNLATKYANEAAQLGDIGLSPAGKKILKGVEALGKQSKNNTVDFDLLRRLRKSVLREKRAMDITKDASAHLVGELRGEIDVIIDNIPKTLTGGAGVEYRAANAFYTKGEETFNNEIIKKITRLAGKAQEPEKIVPYIFVNKGVSRAKAAKEALGADSAAWAAAKAEYVHDLLIGSNLKEGMVAGSNITAALRQLGPDMVNEVFSESEQTMLRQLARFAELQGRKSTELATGGGVVVPIMQAGSIAAILSGRFKQASATILIAPEVVAQLASRPTSAKLFTEGLLTPAGSEAASGISARLAAMVMRINTTRQQPKGETPFNRESSTSFGGSIIGVRHSFGKSPSPSPAADLKSYKTSELEEMLKNAE